MYFTKKCAFDIREVFIKRKEEKNAKCSKPKCTLYKKNFSFIISLFPQIGIVTINKKRYLSLF